MVGRGAASDFSVSFFRPPVPQSPSPTPIKDRSAPAPLPRVGGRFSAGRMAKPVEGKRHAPARTGARPGSRQDEAWLLSLALNGYWEVTSPQNRRSEPTDLRPRGPISQGIGSEADRVWLETAAPPVFGKG